METLWDKGGKGSVPRHRKTGVFFFSFGKPSCFFFPMSRSKPNKSTASSKGTQAAGQSVETRSSRGRTITKTSPQDLGVFLRAQKKKKRVSAKNPSNAARALPPRSQPSQRRRRCPIRNCPVVTIFSPSTLNKHICSHHQPFELPLLPSQESSDHEKKALGVSLAMLIKSRLTMSSSPKEAVKAIVVDVSEGAGRFLFDSLTPSEDFLFGYNHHDGNHTYTGQLFDLHLLDGVIPQLVPGSEWWERNYENDMNVYICINKAKKKRTPFKFILKQYYIHEWVNGEKISRSHFRLTISFRVKKAVYA